tara:strand:+ start:277 stop:1392 length:1116 start_codon:yes stop_codon:yes gene_type:complete
MSEFFNKKEEVLDIQLTQHGKYLLSIGKFDPQYYAFFDDDIIYDTSYAGITETQNESEERIFSSPRNKTQYMYYGAETKINQVNKLIRSNFENWDKATKIQNTPEKSLVMQYPIGNSDMNKENSPAWNLRAYGAPVSSSAEFVSSSSGYINHISQVDLDYTLRTGIGFDIGMTEQYSSPTQRANGSEAEQEAYAGTRFLTLSDEEGSGADEYMSEIFDDGSYIKLIERKFVLLDLKEENTDHLLENFEVEVFKIEKKEDGEEVLQPLTFAKRNNKLRGLIETDESLEDNFAVTTLTPKNVEWYFDLLLDDEINANIACGNLNEEQISEMYENSSFDVDCSKLGAPTGTRLSDDASGIYGNLPSGQDEEPCD